jgi:hypothetical protein
MNQYCIEPDIRMRFGACDRSSDAGSGRSVKFFGGSAKGAAPFDRAQARHRTPCSAKEVIMADGTEKPVVMMTNGIASGVSSDGFTIANGGIRAVLSF